MIVTKRNAFSGIAPKVNPRLLPAGMGQNAENCRLFSGTLASWRRPTIVASATKGTLGAVKSIFLMRLAGVDKWLNWNTDVNCVRGPIAGDTSERIYYTGDGEPRVSNLALATAGPDFPTSWFVLGVTRPTTAASMGHTGGSGSDVTRAMVYTFVTQWGEESAPSPPVTATGNIDATSWDVTNMQTAPANSYTISAAAWAAGVLTLTFNTIFGLRAGEYVDITGLGPASLNTRHKIDSAASVSTVKILLPDDPGSITDQTGTATRVAPHNTTGMRKRLYVTGDTGTGETEFQFWAEVAVATTSHSAAISDAALGEVLLSEDWDMPPVDMQGVIEHENGVLAAFSKNELCFCEPFRPHAWPNKYRQATSRDIVGMGTFARGIVAATKSEPYIVTGTHPENYTATRINRKAPCLSKRGVASFTFGVLYPTTDGLMLIGEGGVSLSSEGILSKKEWATFAPATIHAQEYQGRYFGWFEPEPGVIKGFIFDRGGQGPDLVPLAIPATASYTDPENGELYLVEGGNIKQFDGDPLNHLPYDWLSAIEVHPKPLNPGYAKVEAKYEDLDDDDEVVAQKDEDTALNAPILGGSETHPGQGVTQGEMNGAMWNQMMWNGSLLIGGNYPNFDNRTLVYQLYALNTETNEMELKHTEFPVSNKVFSLPAGYESSQFAHKLAGNIEAFSLEVAETAEELERV